MFFIVVYSLVKLIKAKVLSNDRKKTSRSAKFDFIKELNFNMYIFSILYIIKDKYIKINKNINKPNIVKMVY